MNISGKWSRVCLNAGRLLVWIMGRVYLDTDSLPQYKSHRCVYLSISYQSVYRVAGLNIGCISPCTCHWQSVLISKYLKASVNILGTLCR